jgi:hypothetical protein
MQHLELHHRKLEAELIEVLKALDLLKAYQPLGYPSLFMYAVKELKLTSSVAYAFISVARKSTVIPSLSAAARIET